MKIAFIGGVKFSHEILSTILANKKNVSIVFSYEENKKKSFSDMISFDTLTNKYRINHIKVDNINDKKNVKILKEIKPDVILVMGWSQLLKSEIIKIPKYGVIGSHPTELPKFRGRAPIPWTILKKLKKSALTFFYIQEGVDNGDIILQKKFAITSDDDASSLYEKIIQIGKEMIIELLLLLESEKIMGKKQDSKMFLENWPKRTPEDGRIDWKLPAEEIHRLIRASTKPYPGAFTFFKNRKITIWKSSFENNSSEGEGMIQNISNNEIHVGTGNGIIIIQKKNIKNNEKLEDIFSGKNLGEFLGK